jgi:hypothetical protein
LGIDTRVKSKLGRDARGPGPSRGSDGVGDVYVFGSRLETAENRTQRSSSCNSRKRGLAAYSSALENVPGDKKASSSKSEEVVLKESGSLPSGRIGGTGPSIFLCMCLVFLRIWGNKEREKVER